MNKALRTVFVLCFIVLSGNAWAADADGWSSFELIDGNMLVDAAIAGHPTKAELSMSSTAYGIDRDFAREHSDDLRLAMNGDDVYVVSAAGTEFRVRPYIDTPVTILGYDTVLPTLVPGNYAGGLMLGEEFFDKAIVQIDYPNRRFRKLKRRALKLKKIANVEARRTSARGGLSVKVVLDGVAERWLEFQSSSENGIVISRGLADRHGWLEKYPVTRHQFLDFAGVAHDVLRFHMATLQLGPYTLENVIVNVPDTLEWRGLTLGTIDLDAFKHFVVTMDAKKRLMHIAAPLD